MIELKVESYCSCCPEFEADVRKDTMFVNTFDEQFAHEVCNTTITCVHADRCRGIKKFLAREAKKGTNNADT